MASLSSIEIDGVDIMLGVVRVDVVVVGVVVLIWIGVEVVGLNMLGVVPVIKGCGLVDFSGACFN